MAELECKIRPTRVIRKLRVYPLLEPEDWRILFDEGTDVCLKLCFRLPSFFHIMCAIFSPSPTPFQDRASSVSSLLVASFGLRASVGRALLSVALPVTAPMLRQVTYASKKDDVLGRGIWHFQGHAPCIYTAPSGRCGRAGGSSLSRKRYRRSCPV